MATRVFVGRGPRNNLHLADNVADAVVAAGDASGVPETEVLRVLRPQGRAILGKKELVKPFPPGVDDWSHPYHGPDNNPQSRDQVARAPYLTQFLADPRYAPVPQVAVASAGRVLWEYPYNNYQLVIRDDALFGIGGQIDADPARKFDLLTGKVLAEIKVGRRACTRVAGAVGLVRQPRRPRDRCAR